MRSTLSLIIGLVVLAMGCVNCEPPYVEPIIVEDSVEATVLMQGNINGAENDITGTCLIACCTGLATGTYYTGYDKIQTIWKSFGITGWVYDTLTWQGPLQITKTGGNGSCDSVVFTTSYQVLGYTGETGWRLILATNGKISGSIIAKEQGTYDDPVEFANIGDTIRVIWKIDASLIPQTGSEWLTDTCNFIIVQGIAQNSASKVLKRRYVYDNGDTNDVYVQAPEYSHANDTSWARVAFPSLDTARSAGTCIWRGLYTQSGKLIHVDTLDKAIPEGGAYKSKVIIEVDRL